MANGRNRNQGGKVDQVEYGVTEQTTAAAASAGGSNVAVNRMRLFSASGMVSAPVLYTDLKNTDASGVAVFYVTDTGLADGQDIFSSILHVSADPNVENQIPFVWWSRSGSAITVNCRVLTLTGNPLTAGTPPGVGVQINLLVAGAT